MGAGVDGLVTEFTYKILWKGLTLYHITGKKKKSRRPLSISSEHYVTLLHN